MNETEARTLIASEIRVERADLVAAKAFILQGNEVWTFRVSQEWGRAVAGGEPPAVFRLSEGDPSAIARQYARFFSAQMAVFQAVWELVAVALLVPATSQIERRKFSVQWTTGRNSGGFDVLELGVPCLEEFARPTAPRETILTDGDLYLAGLPTTSLHHGVKDALWMAVACFRAELFVPAVAMLGAATEGAWIELGRSLVARHPDEAPCKKAMKILEGDVAAIRQIVNTITEQLYARQDLFDDCAKSSGVSLDRLREIATWSHTVREARNVLHWGVSPNPGNTYEKVAVLLMSALQNVGDLEKLRVASTIP